MLHDVSRDVPRTKPVASRETCVYDRTLVEEYATARLILELRNCSRIMSRESNHRICKPYNIKATPLIHASLQYLLPDFRRRK